MPALIVLVGCSGASGEGEAGFASELAPSRDLSDLAEAGWPAHPADARRLALVQVERWTSPARRSEVRADLPVGEGLSGAGGAPNFDPSSSGDDFQAIGPHLRRPGEGQGVRVVADAKFARFRQVEAGAVWRLMAARDYPEGGCAWLEDEPIEPFGEGAQLQLLDLGALELSLASVQLRLRPRMFPAVGSLATGAFYAAEGRLPLPRAEHDVYRFRSVPGLEAGREGELPVGVSPAIDIAIVAPEPLSGLSLSGEALVPGAVLESGQDQEMTWDAGSRGHRIEVELIVGADVLGCRFHDDGHLSLPATLFEGRELEGEAALLLRRVRNQRFELAGVGPTIVRLVDAQHFDLSFR